MQQIKMWGLSDTFYKCAVGTKSNKILKRAFANKETVKDPTIESKKNDTFEFDEIWIIYLLVQIGTNILYV